MPTYDYQCTKCGYKFHLFQAITAKPKTRCLKCKSIAQRLISGGGGIIFKGSGFYVTDYKKKEQREQETEPKESAAKKESDSSSDIKSEKPDAKDSNRTNKKENKS